MDGDSRTKNTLKNIIVNNIYQILNILLNFVIRTIFIRKLSESYLGISGLFGNILSVLSLAELGVGTAMVYSMYKPLAENNQKRLSALIGYYKILYRKIALVILIVGLMIIPLLPYIVNLDEDIGNIQLYYILYLMNSVFSYLLLYKSSIVIADQKEYLVKKYEIIFLILRIVLQLIVLIFFENYMLYLIVQIFSTILTNILKSRKAEKTYSFINKKEKLLDDDKKIIWGNIKSLLFYQVGNVILNNTDNILISILLGTTLVGYYSNYNMIITAVAGITSLIFTSMQSSIGNFNVKSNKNEKYLIYKVLSLLSFVIYSFCAISMIILFQDFITMWIGKKYLLDSNILIIIVINYYITAVLYPNWCYRYTTDLFNKAKYAILICAVINIILSIILGMKMGLFGIFLATAISRIVTTFWYEPYILYKNIFKRNISKYFLRQIIYTLILFVLGILIFLICNQINLSNIFIKIIIKEIICICVLVLSYFTIFRKTEEYKFLKNKFIHILKNK